MVRCHFEGILLRALCAEPGINVRKGFRTVEFLRHLSGERLQLQHSCPEIWMVVIEVSQFLLLGIGTEPAATAIGKLIDRRQQPRLAAELLGIIFRIVVLFQKGHLRPGQA